MRLIDLLNKMEHKDTLAPLYKAGAATLAVYAQRELYNCYQALLSSSRYVDQPTKAAATTAEACQVSVSTVCRALRALEWQVS